MWSIVPICSSVRGPNRIASMFTFTCAVGLKPGMGMVRWLRVQIQVAPAGNRLTQDPLAVPTAVVGGGIEEVDAAVQSAMDGADGLGIIDLTPNLRAHRRMSTARR
jgi:hypothetical protein